jgi:hypothetical protein
VWANLAAKAREHLQLLGFVKGEVSAEVEILSGSRTANPRQQSVFGVINAPEDPGICTVLLDEPGEIGPSGNSVANVDPA